MSCEVLTEKEVTTKKGHVCFACGRTFPAGTKMTYQTNILEGEFGSVYICQTCKELLVVAYAELIEDYYFPQDCIRNAVLEAKLKTPEEWLNALTQKANHATVEGKE